MRATLFVMIKLDGARLCVDALLCSALTYLIALYYNRLKGKFCGDEHNG
jgi:hypothetical protein